MMAIALGDGDDGKDEEERSAEVKSSSSLWVEDTVGDAERVEAAGVGL